MHATRRMRIAVLWGAAGALGLGATVLRAEDLTEYGRRWNEIQSGWESERLRHQQAMDKLKSEPQTPETQRKIDSELAGHDAKSKQFAGQRQVIQDKIVTEANRRAAGGRHETSAPGRKTAGTDPTSARGRGMAGDGDYGAGARTADKVRDVLDDMGIKARVKTTPSTVEIGDGMNLTVNKEGKLGRPGSGAHQTQVSIDARVKDTYVSESMQKGQPGRDYVEVQDHKKKAVTGLTSDPADLPRNPEGARDMVKGATKSLDHLPPAEAEKILAKHGLTPDDMAAIKEGRANITPENAERVQKASREAIDAAETRTRAKADAEMASTQRRVAELESSGNRAEARKLREQLVDSRAKIEETTIANTEAKAQARGKAKTPVDAPEGKARVATDAPDGPRGPAPDAPEGKAGKAMDKAGKGMIAIEILSGAEDFKQAAREGDVEGMGRAVVNTVDGVTGGVKGTVDTLSAKRADYAAAQSEIERANALNLENQNQRIAIDLQRSGMGKDEIRRILDAKARGDDAPLRESYDRLGKKIPDLIVEKGPEGDDTVADRARQVAAGMGEKVGKAGKFLKETGEDLTEIGVGLTEKGVARELIDQQKENLRLSNIADGLEVVRRALTSDGELEGTKDALANRLVEKGASRDDAVKAVEALKKGDRSGFDALKEKLGLPTGKTADAGADAKDKIASDGRDAKDKTAGDGRDAKGTRSRTARTPTVQAPEGAGEGDERDAPKGRERLAGGGATVAPEAPDGPMDHAGKSVPADEYEDGDLVVSPDGTEYEKRGDRWVKTGENHGPYDPDKDLRSEPAVGEWEETANPGDRAGRGSTFANARNARSRRHTSESFGLSTGRRDVDAASTSGDRAAADAKQTVEGAGREAQATRSEAAAGAAAGAREDGWGKAVADGAQKGIEAGLAAAGAAFGSHAAEAAAGSIFGGKGKDPKAEGGGSGDASAVPGAAAKSAATRGSGLSRSASSGDGRRSGSGRPCELSGSGRSSSGKDSKSSPGESRETASRPGRPAPPEDPMVTCPGCERTFRGKAGQGVPCPYCVTMSCPACGYTKNYDLGSEPSRCPMCPPPAPPSAPE